MKDILQNIQKENLERSGSSGEGTEQFKSKFISGINIEAVERDLLVIRETKKKTLPEIRTTLTTLTEQIYQLEEQEEYHQGMGIERDLPKEVFKVAKSFFIPDFEYSKKVFADIITDLNYGLISENHYPLYAGRYIYPVFGFNSEVLGYIGYDKYHQIKYLLSKTYGFTKKYSFYGMHLMRWIYSQGYVVVVEGIVDCLYLWMHGIPAIGLNGSRLTNFVKNILLRFEYNVILCPDNDDAGRIAINYWKKALPKASTLNVTGAKDLDAWRMDRRNTVDYLKETIKRCNESALIKIPIEVTLLSA